MSHSATFAYVELEKLAEKRLSEHGVSLFGDLPDSVQKDMLAQQDAVFAKFDVSASDFISPNPFIAAD